DGAHPREHRFAVVLEHVADLGVLERLAIEQDLARIDWYKARDHVDQGALAAAVGPEHRDDLAFGNVEIEVFVQRPTREVLGEAADGDVRAGRAGLERGHRDIREYGRIQYGIHLPLQWMILRSMSRNNTLSAYPKIGRASCRERV